MEKIGHIEIRISGSKGNFELSPDNYDIREIMSILENAENLLYPGDKKNRPTISYEIEHGSVRNIFKTSIQYVIAINAIIGEINTVGNIDFLDNNTARAFENIQQHALKNDYTFTIATSLDSTNSIVIDKSTNYIRTEDLWFDAEFYLYGEIDDAGGAGKSNIHLKTTEHGRVTISTPKSFLKDYKTNFLYKNFGIRAKGKQNSVTGEIDTSHLEFVELITYTPTYDEKYLKALREKAKKTWVGKINADEWIAELRESYEG